MSHVQSSNCTTHITICNAAQKKKNTERLGRHLTLVYMRHVTFMLIVESENINSIRALFFFFGVCFQRQNLFSGLNSNAHALKISNFFFNTHTYLKWKTSRDKFWYMAATQQSCTSFAISFIRSHRNINKPKKATSDSDTNIVNGFFTSVLLLQQLQQNEMYAASAALFFLLNKSRSSR